MVLVLVAFAIVALIVPALTPVLGRRVFYVAALAPALMPWHKMRARRVWQSRAQWRSMDPLANVDALRDVPTGIWCGSDDPFIDGVRAFIRRATPEVADIDPGGHNNKYFRTTVPGLLRFLGRHAPRRPRRPA